MIYILITNALILVVIFAILNRFRVTLEDYLYMLKTKDKTILSLKEGEISEIERRITLRAEYKLLERQIRQLTNPEEYTYEVKCVECGFFKDVGRKTSSGGVTQFECTHDGCYDTVKESSPIYGTTSSRIKVRGHKDLNKDNKCKFFVDRSICK